MKLMYSVWNQSATTYGIWIIITISIAIVLLQVATKGLGWNPFKTYAWALFGAAIFMLIVSYSKEYPSHAFVDPPITLIPVILLIGLSIVGVLQLSMILLSLTSPNMAYGFLPGSIGPVAVIFILWVVYKILGSKVGWVVESSTTGVVLAIALFIVTFFLLREIDVRPKNRLMDQTNYKKVEIAKHSSAKDEVRHPV